MTGYVVISVLISYSTMNPTKRLHMQKLILTWSQYNVSNKLHTFSNKSEVHLSSQLLDSLVKGVTWAVSPQFSRPVIYVVQRPIIGDFSFPRIRRACDKDYVPQDSNSHLIKINSFHHTESNRNMSLQPLLAVLQVTHAHVYCVP